MNNNRPSQLPTQKATPSQLPPVGQQQVPELYQNPVGLAAPSGWLPASSQIQPGLIGGPIPMQQTGLITNPQYLQSQQVYAQQQPLIQSTGQVVTQGNVIKGESRIEYIPYTKEVTEYVTQEVVEYVPRERKITDYYAVEYVTEHIPQVIQEKYIEYVPVETIKERTEYQAVTKQSVIQTPVDYQQIQTSQQYQVTQPIQYAQTTTVQQPIQYAQTTVQQPIQYAQTTVQQPIQYAQTTQTQYLPATTNQFATTTVPITTSQFVPQTYAQTTYGQPTTTYLPPTTTYGQTTTQYGGYSQQIGQQQLLGQATTTTTQQQYSSGWQQVYPQTTGNIQSQQRPTLSPKYQ